MEKLLLKHRGVGQLHPTNLLNNSDLIFQLPAILLQRPDHGMNLDV